MLKQKKNTENRKNNCLIFPESSSEDDSDKAKISQIGFCRYQKGLNEYLDLDSASCSN